MHIEVAYTGNVEEAKEWAEAVKEAFPQFDFHMDHFHSVLRAI